MNSNSALAAAILFAFFVYVTTKGELLDYLGIVGLGPKAGDWKAKGKPTPIAVYTAPSASAPGAGTSLSGGGSGSSLLDMGQTMLDAAPEILALM